MSDHNNNTMDPQRPRRASAVTGMFQAIRRGLMPPTDSGLDEEELQEAMRRRLLRMCYLWPMTACFGTVLPLLVYLQFRQDPEVALHARHGVVVSALFTVFSLVLGLVHGTVGRFVVDWTNVTFVCGLVLLAVVVMLTVLGLRWYRRALSGEAVEIPLITGLAERL
ncbi:MAG: hypothetical protein AAFS10_12300 [Myxococcota bacterium]